MRLGAGGDSPLLLPHPPILVITPVVLALLIAKGKAPLALRMLDWRLFFLFVVMALANYGALSLYRFDLVGPPLLLASILLSQVVSNVPAAFLLSCSADWRVLAIGVNIGGSGTLISSVATVIAYRYIKRYDARITVRDFMSWGAFFCGAQTAIMVPLLFLT